MTKKKSKKKVSKKPAVVKEDLQDAPSESTNVADASDCISDAVEALSDIQTDDLGKMLVNRVANTIDAVQSLGDAIEKALDVIDRKNLVKQEKIRRCEERIAKYKTN